MTNPGITDLLAYWRMEEASGVRADSHGSYDCTFVYNNPGFGVGRQGNALDLDGINQGLGIGDSPGISMGGDVSFCIGLWFKASNITSNIRLMGKWSDTDVKEYTIAVYSSRINFYVRDGANLNSHYVTADNFGDLSNDTWYFVYAYYDADSNIMGVGVNDVFNSGAGPTDGVFDGWGQFWVGRGHTAGYYLEGLIDEAFIYKERLLGTAERTWMYNSGSGRTYADLLATDPTTRDLVAWWRMEEASGDRVDSHDNSLDLIAIFSPGNDTGIQGNAVDLSGSQQVLYHVDDALLSMGGDIPFVIGLWFKPHSIATDNMVILSKWDEGGDQEYLISQYGSRARFTIRNAAGTTSHFVTADSFGDLSNDTWYFLVAYYIPSTNWMWIGINNVFTAAASSTTGVRDDTNRLYFGREVDGSFPHYDGLIDEVFIYRNRLLSTGEKTWLYNSGSGRTYSEIEYVHDLTADDIDSADPVLGTPALAHMYNLAADNIDSAYPVLGRPLAGLPLPWMEVIPLLTGDAPLIYVLNPVLDVIAIIEDYYSLIWVERYSEVGDFELELPIEYALDSTIAFGNFLYIGASDKLMLIEDIKPSFGEELSSLLVKGQSSECLLKRRVLLNPINVDGIAEEIIYTFVDENVTSPVNTNREIDLFKTTFPSVSTSEAFAEQVIIQTVYDVVKLICKNTGLGFKIVNENDKLAFSVYKGENRSYDQGANSYVIFSDDFDNVIASSFYESEKDKINIVLVTTEDQVVALRRTFVWEEGEGEPAGLDRSETVLEAGINRLVGYPEEVYVEPPPEPPEPEEDLPDPIPDPTLGVVGRVCLDAVGITANPVMETYTGWHLFDNLISVGITVNPEMIIPWRGGPPLSDAEMLTIITTKGRQLIEEDKSVGLFEGDFDIQGNFKYGVDFFMGDVVQCDLEGKNVKARVIELVRSYSTEGEKSYVAMDFII